MNYVRKIILKISFLEGNYNDLSKYLALLGGYGEDSRIIKCIQKFTESDEAIESVSKK